VANTILNKLKPTRREYQYSDRSGYGFTIVTSLDKESGWSAKVEFSSHGLLDEDGAVQHLLPALKHFIRTMEKQ